MNLQSFSIKKFESDGETGFSFCDSINEIISDISLDDIWLIDENLQSNNEITELIKQIQKVGCVTLHVTGGEDAKTLSTADQLLKNIPDKNFARLIIIGGGSVINLGYYLAAKLNLNTSISPVVIPTNSMAIADVAVGSLGLLNDDIHKNSLRLVCDPAKILIIKKVFKLSEIKQKSDGLIELSKHAVFQDRSILEKSIDAFLFPVEHEKELLDLSVTAMRLKAQVQNLLIIGRDDLQNILRYGHSHAHALESMHGFLTPHSHAVYAGLLIDLDLKGPQESYYILLDSLKKSSIREKIVDLLKQFENEDIWSHYKNTEDNKISIAVVPEIGWNHNLEKTIQTELVTKDEITVSVIKTRGRLLDTL